LEWRWAGAMHARSQPCRQCEIRPPWARGAASRPSAGSAPGWPGAPGQTRLPGAPEQRRAGTSDEVAHGDGHGSAFGADGVLAGLAPAGRRPAPVVGQSPTSGDRSGRRRDRVSSGSLCSGAFKSPPRSTRSAGRSRGDSSADGVLLMAVGPVPSRRRVVLMTRVWRMPEGPGKRSPHCPWRGSGSGTTRQARRRSGCTARWPRPDRTATTDTASPLPLPVWDSGLGACLPPAGISAAVPRFRRIQHTATLIGPWRIWCGRDQRLLRRPAVRPTDGTPIARTPPSL
jgi:hypothetical protein